MHLARRKGSALSFSARLCRLQFDQPQDDVALALTGRAQGRKLVDDEGQP